jgi:hypothetical protein
MHRSLPERAEAVEVDQKRSSCERACCKIERIRNVIALSRWLATALAIVFSTTSGSGQTPPGEWRFYGSDAHSTKYSALEQINKDNVKDLQIAWRWRADNFGPRMDPNWGK